MLALKEAIKQEVDAEIILEKAGVGDHPANGLVENAVKNTQGEASRT